MQPGLVSKPNVDNGYICFESVIPESAMVLVVLPQELWVVLMYSISLELWLWE